MSEPYDQQYFDKWYRNPRHRVSSPAATTRKATLAVAVAEYYLERPIRSVLDVGCGEGQWRAALRRLRPRIRYEGLDASEYAVTRYGRSRNLRLASFEQMSEVALGARYDLIVCSDLLYYVPVEDLRRGLATLVAHLGGIAFLEAYTADDRLEGDILSIPGRNVSFYRRLFRRLGLMACGSHCYVGPALADRVATMERGI